MDFLVTAYDKPNSLELRNNTRDSHLQYLKRNINIIVTAGPILVDNKPIGSCLIVSCAGKDELDELLNNDPYKLVGLFDKVDIQVIKVGILNKEIGV